MIAGLAERALELFEIDARHAACDRVPADGREEGPTGLQPGM